MESDRSPVLCCIYNGMNKIRQKYKLLLTRTWSAPVNCIDEWWKCKRDWLSVRMSHYSGLYDIQMLAMLSCVFAASKRGTTLNRASSPHVERQRLASHNPTNTVTDVAPTNVCHQSALLFFFLLSIVYFCSFSFVCSIYSVYKINTVYWILFSVHSTMRTDYVLSDWSFTNRLLT